MIDKFNLSRITKLIGTLLVLSPLLFSQVVIKDSVKISPKTPKQIIKAQTTNSSEPWYRFHIDGSCAAWNDTRIRDEYSTQPPLLTVSAGEFSVSDPLNICFGGWGSSWTYLYEDSIFVHEGDPVVTIGSNLTQLVYAGSSSPPNYSKIYQIRVTSAEGNQFYIGNLLYYEVNPYPEIEIVTPYDGEVFLVNGNYLPEIECIENHSGINTTISWSRSPAIPTQQIYQAMQSQDTTIQIIAGATNRYGSAADTITIGIHKGEEIDHFVVAPNPGTIGADHNNWSMIDVTPVDASGNPISINEETMITLSLSANNYALFYGSSSYYGELSITVPYWEFLNGYVRCFQEGPNPDSTITLTLTASTQTSPVKSGIGYLVIESAGCPVVELSSNHISPGDTVQIRIKKRFPIGAVTNYDEGARFDFSIIQGSNYGALVNSDEDGNIIYKTNPALFVANESIDGDSGLVVISGGLSTISAGRVKGGKSAIDTSSLLLGKKIKGKNLPAQLVDRMTAGGKNIAKNYMKGSQTKHLRTVNIQTDGDDDEEEGCTEATGSIVIKSVNKKVQIVDHEPRAIWPYLPPQTNEDGTKSSRGADRTGYNAKKSFEIKVTDASNKPLKNEKITIFAKYQIGTGGHGHKGFVKDTGTTKADTLQPTKLQGTFYSGNNNSGKNNKDTLQLTTNVDGIAKVDSFRASEASGKYLITAWLTSDTTVFDTVNMQIKVPDFVEFGTGTYWRLTGTASNRGKNHLNNHWCTQKTKDSLEAAIQEFYEWTQTEEGGKNTVELGINDMCLNWGGAFDISGQWKFGTAHSFHRVGLSVDIDNAGIKKTDPNNAKKKILTDRGLQLQKIMKTYGGYIYDENEIHFGFNNGS